jgi:bifunctional non-homologous end joining protein LigD
MKMTIRYQKGLLDSISQAVEWRSRGKSPRLFFVKLHYATRLHYDFRLEYRGVLKSWVVPEGPCLDANVKRSAILVNDHAINYFEGVIPNGMYGAGPVMLWDWGFWTTDQDVSEALRAGQLNFRLDGEKLKGSWTLTRWRPRSDQRQTKWELRKALDIEARSIQEMDILIQQPRSVWTGRDLDEIRRSTRSLIPGRSPRKRKQTPDPSQRDLFPDDCLSQLVASSAGQN